MTLPLGYDTNFRVSPPAPVRMAPDAILGSMFSATVQLGVAGTPSVVNLPDTAQGFRLWPISTDIRFSIGADTVAALPTITHTPVLVADLAVGGIAKAGYTEVRNLTAYSSSRTLNLLGTVDNQQVIIEIW